MKNINFNKSYTDLGGNKFEFRYEGIVKDEYGDLKNVEEILDDYVKNCHHSDMIRNIAVLRTVLKDYEEKLLVVSYNNTKVAEEVKYDNSHIFFFERTLRNEKDGYIVKYEPGSMSEIEFQFFNKENDICEYPYNKNVSKLTESLFDYIYKLKHTSAVELDKDVKTLVEIYKLYYNEEPNFKDESISLKVQTMMLILSDYNISLDDEYIFDSLTSKLPKSMKLEQLINRLKPLGYIPRIGENIEMPDKTKKIIKIVGENVMACIGNEKNKNQELVKISKIIHSGRHNCVFKDDETNITLVKKIDRKIDEQLKEDN